MSLALEARRNGVVAVRFFAKTHFGKLRIAHHQIARDERHFDGFFPLGIKMRARTLRFR